MHTAVAARPQLSSHTSPIVTRQQICLDNSEHSCIQRSCAASSSCLFVPELLWCNFEWEVALERWTFGEDCATSTRPNTRTSASVFSYSGFMSLLRGCLRASQREGMYNALANY